MIVRIGKKYFDVRINPSRRQLRGAIVRQRQRGRLASAIRLELKLRKLMKNPGRVVMYFKLPTGNWTAGVAKAGESSEDVRTRLIQSDTEAVVHGVLPGEWRNYMRHAKYYPEYTVPVSSRNPLIKSKKKSSVSKNISYMLRHPGELTAKTKKMKRKQAIAIALKTWRKAMRK